MILLGHITAGKVSERAVTGPWSQANCKGTRQKVQKAFLPGSWQGPAEEKPSEKPASFSPVAQAPMHSSAVVDGPGRLPDTNTAQLVMNLISLFIPSCPLPVS